MKKLDREKKAPERGFLVVGAAPWPARTERRWRTALLVLAAGAAAASAVWLAWRGPAREQTRAAAAPSTPAAPVARPLPTPEPLRPSPRAAAVKPAAKASPAAELQLQAIGERDGKPVAVLSNRLVHEGDRFDGVTVVRIGADEVEVEQQGRRRILRF